MAVMSSADLESVIVEVLPTLQAETSVLTRAGASNVSYNTDIVRRVSLGGPAAVEEGAKKPLSDSSIASYNVVRHHLTYILLQQEAFQDTPEGRELTANALSEAVENIVKGFDILVLNGTSPQTGTAFAPAASSNLKDNATQHVIDGASASDVKDILAITKKSKNVILSDAGLNVVQFAETSGGLRMYPEATSDSSFEFWGSKAHHSEALGVDGWSDTTIFENTNVAVAGDFSRIGRSYGQPSIRLYTEALGGVMLGDYNQVGYRIEVPVAYYVEDPSAFTVLKDETA